MSCGVAARSRRHASPSGRGSLPSGLQARPFETLTLVGHALARGDPHRAGTAQPTASLSGPVVHRAGPEGAIGRHLAVVEAVGRAGRAPGCPSDQRQATPVSRSNEVKAAAQRDHEAASSGAGRCCRPPSGIAHSTSLAALRVPGDAPPARGCRPSRAPARRPTRRAIRRRCCFGVDDAAHGKVESLSHGAIQ